MPHRAHRKGLESYYSRRYAFDRQALPSEFMALDDDTDGMASATAEADDEEEEYEDEDEDDSDVDSNPVAPPQVVSVPANDDDLASPLRPRSQKRTDAIRKQFHSSTDAERPNDGETYEFSRASAPACEMAGAGCLGIHVSMDQGQ